MLYHLSYSRVPSAGIVESPARDSRLTLTGRREPKPDRRAPGDYLGGMIWK